MDLSILSNKLIKPNEEVISIDMIDTNDLDTVYKLIELKLKIK